MRVMRFRAKRSQMTSEARTPVKNLERNFVIGEHYPSREQQQ